jgi:hypothetical protein
MRHPEHTTTKQSLEGEEHCVELSSKHLFAGDCFVVHGGLRHVRGLPPIQITIVSVVGGSYKRQP